MIISDVTKTSSNKLLLNDKLPLVVLIFKVLLVNTLVIILGNHCYVYTNYIYFEKGCQKKCMQQSRKVLWVVWVHCSSKKCERTAQEAMDVHVCLWMLMASNKSRFDSYNTSRTVYWSYAMLPFGIVVCIFFPTIFLEIGVCCQSTCQKSTSPKS